MPPLQSLGISDHGNSPSRMKAVTPHDTTELTFLARAISVAVAGDVAMVNEANDAVTIAVPAGVQWSVGTVKLIKSTGTTATGIHIYG